MAIGIGLSLGWFVLESCDCDETKEQKFPGFWVACINDKPTLMTYNGDNAVVVSTTPAGNFNPSDYECEHDASSPSYKGSSDTPPFKISSPSGPQGPITKPRAVSSLNSSYPPQPYLDLPFVPHVPPNTSPACDSSFPDVFQTDQTQALVTRIATCPFSIKATIPVVANPLQVQVTPDGSTAVVTSFFSAVNFIDLATNTVSYTLMTDPSINPHGLAISPDGTRAYITSFNENNIVAVIDMSTRQIIATYPTAVQYPQGATLTPDGSQLWITSPLSPGVDVIDTLSGTHVFTINVNQTTDVAFNSTGTLAFITSTSTVPGTVVEVDTSNYQTLNTFTVGTGPTDIKMSYGNEFLVVNNNGENSVSVIDLVKNSVVTLQVGGNPYGIAFVH